MSNVNYIKIEIAAGKLNCSMSEFFPKVLSRNIRLRFRVYDLYVEFGKRSYDGEESIITLASNRQYYTGWLEIGEHAIINLIYGIKPRYPFFKEDLEVWPWGKEASQNSVIGLNEFYIREIDLESLLQKQENYKKSEEETLPEEAFQQVKNIIKRIDTKKERVAYHLELLEDLFVEISNKSACLPSIGVIWTRLKTLHKEEDIWQERIVNIDNEGIIWRALGDDKNPTQKYRTVANNISSLRKKYKNYYNL